jgi:hypothetical protein
LKLSAAAKAWNTTTLVALLVAVAVLIEYIKDNKVQG